MTIALALIILHLYGIGILMVLAIMRDGSSAPWRWIDVLALVTWPISAPLIWGWYLVRRGK